VTFGGVGGGGTLVGAVGVMTAEGVCAGTRGGPMVTSGGVVLTVGGFVVVGTVTGFVGMTAPVRSNPSRDTTSIADIVIPTARAPAAQTAITTGAA
jgi:hypothetical protein